MIAYHFPPLAGSSGIQRTLRFVQHLPAYGWEPIVLTAHPRAYERTSLDLNADIPRGTLVRRAFAVDAARHLSIAGRYVASMARPDRWVSWKFDGVRQGMNILRQLGPKAIWSTYPIATAHLIGAELHRRSGLPWIADFRDPMAQDGYPADAETWRQYKAIEQLAIEEASCALFTTPGAERMYRQRYPGSSERISMLENGYDEDSFSEAERVNGTNRRPLNEGCITLLHSGIVYPTERDPTQLFAALGRLKSTGSIEPGRFKVRFRAAVHEDLLRRMCAEHNVEAFVEVLPAIPYHDALQEMLRADALLALQASGCNEQVPAKVYEYLRARRPIVCLTDPAGDTAQVLRRAGIRAIARLDSCDEITDLLPTFVAAVRAGESTLPDPQEVNRASRKARAEVLAKHLDRLVA